MAEKHHCKQCGYLWNSFLDEPKQCPKCKRYDWNGHNPVKKHIINSKEILEEIRKHPPTEEELSGIADEEEINTSSDL